jgi:hypothetical protein
VEEKYKYKRDDLNELGLLESGNVLEAVIFGLKNIEKDFLKVSYNRLLNIENWKGKDPLISNDELKDEPVLRRVREDMYLSGYCILH